MFSMASRSASNDGREGCSEGAGVRPLTRLTGSTVRMSRTEVALYSRTNFDKMSDIVPRQTNERFVVRCVDDFPCEFWSSIL